MRSSGPLKWIARLILLIIAVPFLLLFGIIELTDISPSGVYPDPSLDSLIYGWLIGILLVVLFCLLIKWGSTKLNRSRVQLNSELGGFIIAAAVVLPLAIITKHFIRFSNIGFMTGGATLGTGIGLLLTGEISLKEEKPLIAQLWDTWKQRTARRQ